MFEHCLYFNTTSLARRLEREWAAAFRPFGLTPAQAFMLRMILKKPGLLQSEVAAAMNISRSTATRTLDGLEKLGLAVRRSSDEDGREALIHPTAKGLRLGPALDAASGDVTRRLKQRLGSAAFSKMVGDIRATSAAIAFSDASASVKGASASAFSAIDPSARDDA